MTQPTPTRHARQVGQLQRKIAYAPALPFTELLPGDLAEQAIRDQGVSFRERLFSPLITLWVFLSQVLDPDHSCRAAVARFLAWRTAQGLPPVPPTPAPTTRPATACPKAC
jgi:hypothetical protein